MKVALFDTHHYDRDSFERANVGGVHDLRYLEPRLTADTAAMAAGATAVCSFVNDRVNADTLRILRDVGVRIVALRSAGYNHVDLAAAEALGLPVVRVPSYSPHAVAEHAVGLVMALNRKVHRAHARVREGNFSLEGLVGFDLCGKTVGIVGLGRIGRVAARIFQGFGCRVLAYDTAAAPPSSADSVDGIRYVGRDEMYREADILTLHVPLTPSTRHLIDAESLARMKRGVMIINTGRGALIDTQALVAALKTGQVGAAGLDVYEEEADIFFRDLSDQVLQDDVLARLLTFPNVIVTAHQAFLTHEALAAIATTTLESLTAFEKGQPLVNQVQARDVIR